HRKRPPPRAALLTPPARSYAPRMALILATRGTVQLVQPAGDLDDQVVEELTTALTERIKPGGQILVDLSATNHINSSGLGALVNATAQANVQECRVILAAPSPQVASVLEITKLTRFFEIAPTVQDALARFGR